MTENLVQLKRIFPVLSAVTGTAVFALFRILSNLFLDNIFRKRKNKVIRTEEGLPQEKEEMRRYGKILRKENAKYTWMTKAAGFLSLIMLAASALFHSVLLEKYGPELFAAIILILTASAAFLILQDRRWKAGAADDLLLYAFLFRAAAADDHTGIRMMLSDPDTDIPLKPLLLEIQKDNPGMSGTDLMRTAGRILNSDVLVKDVSEKTDDRAEKKEREIRSGRTDMYSTVYVLSCFAVVITLCFLL